MPYNHKQIEQKWQERWEKEQPWKAEDQSAKKKFYCLVEFPYPSGAGLHVGHPRSYSALDAVVRKRRMEGFNVLYPIGWDAFGLPTENYAIKTGRKPQEITNENTDTFRRQLKSLGLSFDWSREVNTTDPAYYKWTQWMFLKFFEAGLAYKAKTMINWCPKDKIGLANEEVIQGHCERCGTAVEKREKEQWMIAITKYADRLLADLDTVDYLPKIKKQQQDWIGKSEGAEIDFELNFTFKPEANKNRGPNGEKAHLTVFTTRPDTIDGVTFLAIAPEHLWVTLATDDAHDVLENKAEVKAYVESVKNQTEIERTAEGKEKTGVALKGVKAINPVNGEEVPIFVADYILANYGTGAIMGVPQHDERDHQFAETMQVPIVDRPLIDVDEAIEKSHGKKTTRFKLRDWVFSRQRYWGEPIPLVWCDEHKWVAVPEAQLPVVLPEVEHYEPTDNGESPLATISDWVNTTCPTCGKPAKRETDTMPNWAGSSWYFLRYLDPTNDKQFAAADKLKYWMPVDLYNGGMEHTTLHLLYSRFWNKFLFDQGLVPTSEPYARRHSHGLILAEDGSKMSKSKGNVVNPDEIVEQYGADSLRTYILFMGPFEEPVPWNVNGLIGVRRFLDKVVSLSDKVVGTSNEDLARIVHKTIKKVGEDLEGMKFNTAVSQLMICQNAMQEEMSIPTELFELFLKVLFPFAPHLASELWDKLGHKTLLDAEPWPTFDAKLVIDESVAISVQVNGKLRGTVMASPTATQADVEALVRGDEKIAKWLEGQTVKKIIYIAGRTMNIVL